MMKKFSLILPGAIALLMAATPLLAAQSRPIGLLAQQSQQQPRRERANKLNLTDAQKTQMKAIKEQTRNEIVNTILTPEQRTQYNATAQSGNKKGSWRSLNLTDAQKTQVREKMKASRDRINREVLTQAQRDQIQQMRSQRGTRPGR